jgi:glycolate oxidase subunit GlcD
VAVALQPDLARIVGDDGVLPGTTAEYLADATQTRGFSGRADAVVLPRTAEEVAGVLAWCYEHDIPLVPRGGGTGFAGGAVPLEGGIVCSLERLTAVRQFDPLLWRIHVEAGLRTGDLRRIVRESGLFFPPDPGAAEQSQIGGNIATNAGGPHAFKYGVTGSWVLGLEAVVPPGEVVTVGGPIRKDVAGYDLKSLLIGSEGTLGIVTAAWLRLIPAPEAAWPVAAFYPDTATGCAAIEAILGNGVEAAAIEYLDGGTLAVAGVTFPYAPPEGAGFLVLSEADGTAEGARALQEELAEVLREEALAVFVPTTQAEVAALWRWRDGVSIAVTAKKGHKVSEDVVVPLDRLAEAVEATVEIGARHGLEAMSWGHAGDGNLHSSFIVTAGDEKELRLAEEASEELFALAVELGGSISGEHGVGWVKRGHLASQWAPRALELHNEIKRVFDPKNLLNPGKKT